MKSRILYFCILILFSNCLSPKKSLFSLSPNSILNGIAIAFTNSRTSSQTTPPSGLNYTLTAQDSKLYPGKQFVIPAPRVNGTVSSWSITITPDHPSWIVLNNQNGQISISTPTTPPIETIIYNLTITATNAGGSENFQFNLERLKSGENVWTVMNGVGGADTFASFSGMIYDNFSNSIFVTGKTNGNLNGQIIPSTGGNGSGFVSKYDLDGNRIWMKIFGVSGASDTIVQGITSDSNGNIYVSGSASNGNINGLNITVSNPNLAAFIIKFDTNGNQLWINSSAPHIRHEAGGIVIDSSGNLYITTAVMAPSLHQTNLGWTDEGLSIVKYNGTTGAYMSAMMISGNTGTPFLYGVRGHGIAIDNSTGNLYVAGSTRLSTRCGTGTAFFNPALFIINSSTMTYSTCTALSSPGSHSFSFSIFVDSSSNSVYMSGYATSTSFDSQSKTGLIDGFLTKFNLSGTKLWTVLLGEAGKNTAVASIGFNNGKVYISGMTNGNLSGVDVVNGATDMFVARYNPTGIRERITYQKILNDTIGCTGAGCRSSIIFDSNSTLYTTGDTNGSVGGIINPAGTNRSFFLVRNIQ
jgi:hypothetical protein